MNLKRVLSELGKRNVTSVLAEGGGELLGSLFDAGLVDRIAMFYAPLLIGGKNAVTIGGTGAARVKQAITLRECRWRRLGNSEILLEAKVMP